MTGRDCAGAKWAWRQVGVSRTLLSDAFDFAFELLQPEAQRQNQDSRSKLKIKNQNQESKSESNQSQNQSQRRRTGVSDATLVFPLFCQTAWRLSASRFAAQCMISSITRPTSSLVSSGYM